jgi:hypothetical protein
VKTIEEYAAEVVAKAPPLSEEIRDCLAILLAPVRIKAKAQRRRAS